MSAGMSEWDYWGGGSTGDEKYELTLAIVIGRVQHHLRGFNFLNMFSRHDGAGVRQN